MESPGETSEPKEQTQNRSSTPKRSSKKQSESRDPEDISNDEDEEDSEDYSEEESPNESSNSVNNIVEPTGSSEGPSLVRSHNQELAQPTKFEFVGVQPEKKGGRRKINIEFIENKSRRHVTFSKRKSGLIKKAYELSTLTGTQVLLLVASETGNVYTFATPKLQPLITNPEGKAFIQSCLNPDPEPLASSSSSSSTPSSTNRTQTNPSHSIPQRDAYVPPVSSMAHSQNVVNYFSPEGSPKKLPERKDGSGNSSAPFQFPLSTNGNGNASHSNSSIPNSRNAPMSSRANPNNYLLAGLANFPRLEESRHSRQTQSAPFLPASLLGSNRGINFPQNFHGNSLLANLQSSYDPDHPRTVQVQQAEHPNTLL